MKNFKNYDVQSDVQSIVINADVLGKHEFYKETTPRLFEKLSIKSKSTNIHVIENQSFSIDGIRF